MPLYMIHVAYAAEDRAAFADDPERRARAVQALLARIGGRPRHFYYAFGAYDGTIILEAPDEATITAPLIAALADGRLRAVETTPLGPWPLGPWKVEGGA